MSVFHPAAPPVAEGGETGAFVLSALAAIFWGTNFEATRIALVDLPPWSAAAGRVALAVAATLLWLAATRGIAWPVLRRNLLAFTVLGIVGVAGFTATLFLGMRTSSPVTAALIMGTSPLTTNLIDSGLQRRLPSPSAVLGMVVSLLGVALTVGAFSGTHLASGDVLILAGSLLWSLYTIGCRRWVISATPIETSAWTMLSGAVVLGLVAFRLESPLAAFAHAPAVAWGATLWMAVVGSALALIFWQVGIARRGPGATSVLFNLVPVSALVVAAGPGRTPRAVQVVGVAVALLGILLASGRLPRAPIGGLRRRPASR
jgi:drug/metabolite transporter (DMT)-like permease